MGINALKTRVVQDLKKVKQARNLARQLKKIVKDPTGIFFFRFFKRKPVHVFYSADVTFKKARAAHSISSKTEQLLAEIEGGAFEGISLYRDVISVPVTRGTTLDFHGGLVDPATNSLIPEALHFRPIGSLTQELPDLNMQGFSTANLPEVNQPVLFAGILFNHFGHFLLESLGRLWAYEVVKEINPYILFYAYLEEPKFLEKKNFIHQVLTGFGIPLDKVFFLNDITIVKNIIIPVQRYGYGQCKNPDSTFLQFVNKFRFDAVVPKGFENSPNIYVSRTKLPAGSGKPIGESYFEKFLAVNGYTILYPERYTLFEQLSVYTQAEKIIFSDGAALHGCILLPRLKAEVAVIARRKDNRWDTSEITDQFTGYDKEALWIDEVRGQYQFGMETWDAISIVDWVEVSKVLKNNGFVSLEMDKIPEQEYENLVQADIFRFIKKIKKDPRFIRYLMKLKEYA